MSFKIICNKCGSKKVTITADTFFEPHIECQHCGQYLVGEVYDGEFDGNKHSQ